MNDALKIPEVRKLITLGKEKGFNSPETLLLSQNLDEVILKYQKLMH